MEQRMQNDAGTSKRLVRKEDQILSILDEYDKSGFSVRDFCEVSELNEATFYSWVKKYSSKPEEEVKGFTTIEIIPGLIDSKPQLFAEIGNIKLYK